jgi:hypothetical protein
VELPGAAAEVGDQLAAAHRGDLQGGVADQVVVFEQVLDGGLDVVAGGLHPLR